MLAKANAAMVAAAVHHVPFTCHRMVALTSRKMSETKNGLAAPWVATMRAVNVARSNRWRAAAQPRPKLTGAHTSARTPRLKMRYQMRRLWTATVGASAGTAISAPPARHTRVPARNHSTLTRGGYSSAITSGDSAPLLARARAGGRQPACRGIRRMRHHAVTGVPARVVIRSRH